MTIEKQIYILDRSNLVETAKKVNNYTIQELAEIVSTTTTYGELVYVRIQPTLGRNDGRMSFIKIPGDVASDELHAYLLTEEAWRGDG